MPKIRQSLRKKVYEQFGPNCYICGVRLVLYRDFKRNKDIEILEQTEDSIVYKTASGKVRKAYFATIDHIVPFSICQNHKLENLRPCCHSCNNKKDNSMKLKPYLLFVSIVGMVELHCDFDSKEEAEKEAARLRHEHGDFCFILENKPVYYREIHEDSDSNV